MGPDEMQLQVPRELAAEVPKPLPTTFKDFRWAGDVPTDWKKGSITPSF